MSLCLSHLLHTLLKFGLLLLRRGERRKVLGGRRTKRLFGFFLTDDLHHGGFLTAQGYFIAHQFILNGVAQGGVEHYFNLLPLDKPHLDDALSETAVTANFGNHGNLSCM